MEISAKNPLQSGWKLVCPFVVFSLHVVRCPAHLAQVGIEEEFHGDDGGDGFLRRFFKTLWTLPRYREARALSWAGPLLDEEPHQRQCVEEFQSCPPRRPMAPMSSVPGCFFHVSDLGEEEKQGCRVEFCTRLAQQLKEVVHKDKAILPWPCHRRPPCWPTIPRRSGRLVQQDFGAAVRQRFEQGPFCACPGHSHAPS